MLSEDIEVTALVLAGGLGRRMGGPNKLLLPLQGQAVVARTVRAVLASRCTRVLVVLGFDAERVRRELEGLPVEFVLNESFHEGMGTSVRAGAAMVADGSAVVVCLGDMPLVAAAVIDALIDTYKTGKNIQACQPVYEGKRGNPVLWGPASLPALRQLQGDEGARALLRQLGEALALVEVGSGSVLLDADTPEDLQRLNDWASAGGL
jgi:molybdenum cofactor cytidylyltransferase